MFYKESTLTSSEVFKGINEIGEVTQTAKAVNLIKNLEPIKVEEIEPAYIQIKQYPNLLSRSAIKAFDRGEIILLYNKNAEARMSHAIPFLTFRKGNSYVTYVFLDKYMTENDDGTKNINASVLHDFLVSAVISNSLKNDYQKLLNNMFLESILPKLYSRFVTRIINREFLITSDKVLFDIVNYYIGKFFLINIFETAANEDGIENILSEDFKALDDLKYNEVYQNYKTASPNSISALLELISQTSPRLKSLKFPNFLSQWMNYYYLPATLAVDNIEYLIFMIIALLGGNNVVSIAASEIVKETKNIISFKPELMKLL